MRRDRRQYELILKKADEIIENPHHYKNLRRPLQHLKRVHIGSFVLLFSVDEKTVTLVDFEHHDRAYR